MGITLFKVILKKEGVHWRRMLKMFADMKTIGAKFISYPMLVVIVSAFHYAFAGMSVLFEITLWLFNKPQFKSNMLAINLKMDNVRKLELTV